MAKKAKRAKTEKKAKTEKRKRQTPVNLAQTHGPNGSTGAGAMSIDDEDELGPLELPSADDALVVLKELADIQGQRYRAAKDLERLQKQTKKAKDRVEELDTKIAELIQKATRKSDLPLFDEVQAEADVSRIQEQASVVAGEAAPEVPPLALPSAQDAAGDGEVPF